MIRKTLIAFAFVCLILMLFTALAPWSPPADSLALMRPLFGLGTLFGLLASRTLFHRALFALPTLSAIALVWSALGAPVAGDHLRVYSKNLWAQNDHTASVAADILESNADVVALQELTTRNAAILETLRQTYPHQHRCIQHRGHVALLSRHPFVAQQPCDTHVMVAGQINIAGNNLWVASVHITWHWPINSRNSEKTLATKLAALPGPVVVAGDFNSFPWTHRMRQMRKASRTRHVGPLLATFSQNRVALPLPIDHVLAPVGGTLQKRPLFGSDHHGIVADVNISK